MTAHNLKRLLLDAVYPNRCPFCGEIIPYDEYFCAPCPEKLKFFGDGEAVENVVRSFAAFEYDETAAPFIYALKENGNGYAAAAAAKLIYDLLQDAPDVKIDLIACIPPSKSGLRKRGYNPPALIAAELSALTGIPSDVKLLVKTRETETQKELSSRERRENLKGVFAAAKGKTVAGAVLLVDDVKTTGATLGEAAGVLLSAGAKGVFTAAAAAVRLGR
ncbi:MAG: double zinc ribbon domain-containing protein [Oscillospiraceae bacterium]|jgi:ComF family protein|nr:double zinc ribbon domain-containing protein [Oscillospiraceae bacterium]